MGFLLVVIGVVLVAEEQKMMVVVGCLAVREAVLCLIGNEEIGGWIIWGD